MHRGPVILLFFFWICFIHIFLPRTLFTIKVSLENMLHILYVILKRIHLGEGYFRLKQIKVKHLQQNRSSKTNWLFQVSFENLLTK